MSGVGTHRWEALPLLFYRMLSGRGMQMQATAWVNRRPSADLVPQGLPRYECTRLAGGKMQLVYVMPHVTFDGEPSTSTV